MFYSHLVQIVTFLNQQAFKTLHHIRRCDDNLLMLTFDRTFHLFIDMQKSNSAIYLREDEAVCKSYQAAFDTVLSKRFNRTQVRSIEIVNEDKVMRLEVVSRGAYKEQLWRIDFEFTGKYTNAVITDAEGTIIEALRHIDSKNSSREIRPGNKLAPVPKADFAFKEYPLDDVKSYLLDVYNKRHSAALDELKKVKLGQLKKQLKRYEKSRRSLETPRALEEKAETYNNRAQVVLANLYQIKPYETTLHLYDFEGNPIDIILERAFSQPSRIADDFFAKAKKAKQKAKHLHIEEENLDNRISFVKQLIALIERAKSKEAIEQLLPKQKKQSKKEKPKPYETFWFDNYKILLGRHAKANQALLSDCKANDLWFHFKDRPSAHVVIVSDRQKIPEEIIKKAARLCVDFSVDVPGRYSIDYTKRKEVHLQEGSNVLYYKYETIIIEKDA